MATIAQLEAQIETLSRRLEETERELTKSQRLADKLKTEALQARGDAERTAIESHLRAAAVEAGVEPGAIPSVVSLEIQTGQWKLDSQGRLLRHTADGLADMTTGGEYVSPVIGMRQMLREKPFLAAAPAADTSASGAAPGGTGPNPWSRESWHLGKQGDFMVAHGKDKADAMAKAAGSSLYATHPPAE